MFGSVVVIDDDPVFTEIAKTSFVQRGANAVFPFQDAEAALRFIKRSATPDLIVLDINMPNKDGIDVLRELQHMSFSGSIVVVSVEAPMVIDMTKSLGRMHGLNVVDAVQKPLTQDHIDRWTSGLCA